MKTITIWTVIYIPTQNIINSYSNEIDADIFLSKQIDKENWKCIANKLTYSEAAIRTLIKDK